MVKWRTPNKDGREYFTADEAVQGDLNRYERDLPTGPDFCRCEGCGRVGWCTAWEARHLTSGWALPLLCGSCRPR